MIDSMLPINEVAQSFGIRASALRYYDEIGLLKPTWRKSGRRHYGIAELKQLSLIQLLQQAGNLSLEEIADILPTHAGRKRSRAVLEKRIAALEEQIRRSRAAKKYLEYVLSCPRGDPFDGCPILAEELDLRLETQLK
jgi:DNA-binding transcriptional MerR regulator